MRHYPSIVICHFGPSLLDVVINFDVIFVAIVIIMVITVGSICGNGDCSGCGLGIVVAVVVVEAVPVVTRLSNLINIFQPALAATTAATVAATALN